MRKLTWLILPEEKREVQIGKEIIEWVKKIRMNEGDTDENAEMIAHLAHELVEMHQKKPAQQMKDVLDKHNPKPPTN